MALLELRDFTIALAGRPQRSSSSMETAGGHVLVIGTTLPEQALALTSCYLSAGDGDVSVIHLRLDPAGGEQHTYTRLPGQHLGSTHTSRCLLDHAAQLNEALASLIGEPVAIDVGLDALEHAADVWGPPQPRD
jgi:hypothetical protein